MKYSSVDTTYTTDKNDLTEICHANNSNKLTSEDRKLYFQ